DEPILRMAEGQHLHFWDRERRGILRIADRASRFGIVASVAVRSGTEDGPVGVRSSSKDSGADDPIWRARACGDAYLRAIQETAGPSRVNFPRSRRRSSRMNLPEDGSSLQPAHGPASDEVALEDEEGD